MRPSSWATGRPERKLTKPELGHQKKAGMSEFKRSQEFPWRTAPSMRWATCSPPTSSPAGDFVTISRHQQGPRLPGLSSATARRPSATPGGGLSTGTRALWAPALPRPTSPRARRRGPDGQCAGHVLTWTWSQVDESWDLIAVRGAIPGPRAACLCEEHRETIIEKHAAEVGRVKPAERLLPA